MPFGAMSICTIANSNKPISTITDYSLSGYWGPDFAGSPWVGTASAGTSGGLELSEGFSPPTTGAALNGFIPADFDGINQHLTATTSGSTTMTNYITISAYSYFTLFNADTASADVGSTTPYNNPALFSSDGGGMGLSFSDAGVGAWHFNGTDYHTISVSTTTNNWHLAIVTYDGTDLTTYVDSMSGSAQTRSHADSSVLTYTLHVGTNYSISAFFDGRIEEIGFIKTALTSDQRGVIKTYINNKYGLSL